MSLNKWSWFIWAVLNSGWRINVFNQIKEVLIQGVGWSALVVKPHTFDEVINMRLVFFRVARAFASSSRNSGSLKSFNWVKKGVKGCGELFSVLQSYIPSDACPQGWLGRQHFDRRLWNGLQARLDSMTFLCSPGPVEPVLLGTEKILIDWVRRVKRAGALLTRFMTLNKRRISIMSAMASSLATAFNSSLAAATIIARFWDKKGSSAKSFDATAIVSPHRLTSFRAMVSSFFMSGFSWAISLPCLRKWPVASISSCTRTWARFERPFFPFDMLPVANVVILNHMSTVQLHHVICVIQKVPGL